ncbi:e3 SUMO-protein ligase RanBP2 [Caerostris extrusa]|uniref:E3 SUMO-protein ligase RanBP2 n=1 Tax=Caerostris extrusa TaxID=172846 RepID=A0AAV4NV97_CAEEX|nr:e3 SUMO-protein ligase RanBP2 [Caerostris extrusa]
MNSSLRTKKDVERHVADTLSRLNSENEKNLRGFTFARLFFQVKDYEAARKYLSSFLSVRDNHAPAHRLMAQICEAINNPENALQSYKRSLELDPHQIDIVLKICELYCQLSVDHETARYWADRADQLFPHNEIVFKLRECIVSAEGEPNHQELENLILSELAYQEEFGPNLDSQFYVHYLAALDRLIFLTLAEPHSFTCENGKKQYSVNDAAAVLLIFDQLLKKVNEKDIKETFWIDFIHYMKGQLYFYMTSLLLKRVKMDQGNRKEAFRFSAGLALVCYTYKPLNMFPEMWFMKLEDNQQAFIYFLQQGTLRTSFIGHAIINMCKEDESKWLQKLKIEVCIPQVKERIYNRVFSSVIQKDKLSTSYFISDSTFENCSLEFPSELNLKEYDKKAYQLCADSLHHLIWLEMQCDSVGDSEFNISEVFKGLQYSNKIYRKEVANIADALCSKHHVSWWKSAYGLHNCTIKEKLGDHRRVLQHGLEVIRGVGNHGIEVQLVAHLAQKFANKADLLKKVLQQRAIHYWNITLGMLEKMSDGQTLKVPKEQIFSGLNKTLSKNEMKELQEAGHLYIAVYYMDSDKLDEAAEILSKISNPYGSYYLASILQKMASQEENSNTKAILLNKAKSSLLDTMDRIKDDKSHPLNKEIYIILEDIENEFAAELSVNNSQSGDDLEEADSPDAALSYNSSLYVTPSSHKSVRHSTPRPSSKFFNSKSRIESNNEVSHKHFEPSPERLDAQIRALTLNQDTVSKTLLEQQKALVEQQKTFQKRFNELLRNNKNHFQKLINLQLIH